MKAMSDFEKKILRYLKTRWINNEYCLLQDIYVSQIEDFSLEVKGKNDIKLYTTSLSSIEEVKYKKINDIEPIKIKQSEKFYLIIQISELFKYLIENRLILCNARNTQLPNLIYSKIKENKDPNYMSIFEEYYAFLDKYHGCRIYGSQDLIDYVSNEFKTREDLDKEELDNRYIEEKKELEKRIVEESKYRKVSLWIAIIVGAASILFGFFSSIVSFIDHKSNKTVKVRIENPTKHIP